MDEKKSMEVTQVEEKNSLALEEIKEVIGRLPISMNMLAGKVEAAEEAKKMKTEANFLKLASHHRRVLIYFIRHRKPISTEEYIYLPNSSEEEIMSAMHWCLILPSDGKWRLSQVGKKVIETALKYGVL